MAKGRKKTVETVKAVLPEGSTASGRTSDAGPATKGSSNRRRNSSAAAFQARRRTQIAFGRIERSGSPTGRTALRFSLDSPSGLHCAAVGGPREKHGTPRRRCNSFRGTKGSPEFGFARDDMRAPSTALLFVVLQTAPTRDEEKAAGAAPSAAASTEVRTRVVVHRSHGPHMRSHGPEQHGAYTVRRPSERRLRTVAPISGAAVRPAACG